MLNEFVVAPEIMFPFFFHTNVNGPVPETPVTNAAVAPGHRSSELSELATSDSLTVNVAQFVTAPQAPLTATQYVPASLAWTFVMISEFVVAPAIGTSFLVQTNVNGPVPDGTVLNVAVDPGQFVRELRAVLAVVSSTVRVAQFVTAPHAPVTATQYVPASAACTLVTVNELVVAPAIVPPFFRHTKPNGPVPLGAVLKTAVDPGQFVREVSSVVVVVWRIVRLPQFVTLPQAPVTSTQYAPPLLACAFAIVIAFVVWPARMLPSFLQTKLNGPVPDGVVVKFAVVPGQFVKEVSGVLVNV